MLLEAPVQSKGEKATLGAPRRPELVFGLVAPLGVRLNDVTKALRDALHAVGYTTHNIKLTSLLPRMAGSEWAAPPSALPLDRRIAMKMDQGDSLRRKLNRGDALVLLGVAAMREHRRRHWGGAGDGSEMRPIDGAAFAIDQLKHPDEVRQLRGIYGDAFICIGAFSSEGHRGDALAERLADGSGQPSQFLARALELIKRDEEDAYNDLGQRLRRTFWQADFFLNMDKPDRLKTWIERFVSILFGHPFVTPTRDEYAMFLASASALRSACPGRQVGAVVASSEGDILVTGTNEVPSPDGGLYWEGDAQDARDFKKEVDASHAARYRALKDLLERFRRQGLLDRSRADTAIDTLAAELMEASGDAGLKHSDFMSVTEFGRTVHAEMACITDAARRGISIKDSVLYTTTFPCHSCARHIISAGIRRVVYIEPYPKSRASSLHGDALDFGGGDDEIRKVKFRPFGGIAPRRYMSFFEATTRKGEDGALTEWEPQHAKSRVSPDAARYELRETAAQHELDESMSRFGLKFDEE